MLVNNDFHFPFDKERDLSHLSMDEMLKSIGEALTGKKNRKEYLKEEENVMDEDAKEKPAKKVSALFDFDNLADLLNNAEVAFGRERLVDTWEKAGVIKKGTDGDENIAYILTEYRMARLINDPVLNVVEQLMNLFTAEAGHEEMRIPFLLDPFMFSVIKSVYSSPTKKIPKDFNLFKDCLLLSLKAFKEDYYDKYNGYIKRYIEDEDGITDEDEEDAVRLSAILDTTVSPLFAFTVACNLRDNMSEGLVPYFTTGSDGNSRIEIHSRKKK